MKIVFAASEAVPFIKTGGLGDVAGALPKALSEYKGNEVVVFLPYYSKIKADPSFAVEKVGEFEVQLSWRKVYVGLMKLKSKKRKLRIYFIDNEQYFGREHIYGYPDDGERFAFFSMAILESLARLGEKPDIIHCNDWQTALLPTLLHAFYNGVLGKAKTVFTIHNIEYQGWAHPHFLGDVLGLDDGHASRFSQSGAFNAVKGAILSSNAVTTVSKTYAEEICHPYFAHGLSSVIGDHAFKLTGIVNGIDTVENNPVTDQYLPENYGADSFTSGKAACKAELQEECGLSVKGDVPLIGLVSRLVEHKGLELICEAMDEIMSLDVQFVIVGTGDERYENALKNAAARYPDKLSLNLCFDKALASEIYSASDIYLMPSKSEPCGLSQLLAMRYGAVPVVHEIGGLKDTVSAFNPERGEGLGFTFKSFTKDDMLDALRRATDIFRNDKDAWNKAVYNDMTADFSWNGPAEEYMELYGNLVSRV